jgi:hypothetical protein
MTTFVPNPLQIPVAIRLLRMSHAVTLRVIGIPALPIGLALFLVGSIIRIIRHLLSLPGRLSGTLACLLTTVTLIFLTRIGREISPTVTTRYLFHNHHNNNR